MPAPPVGGAGPRGTKSGVNVTSRSYASVRPVRSTTGRRAKPVSELAKSNMEMRRPAMNPPKNIRGQPTELAVAKSGTSPVGAGGGGDAGGAGRPAGGLIGAQSGP